MIARVRSAVSLERTLHGRRLGHSDPEFPEPEHVGRQTRESIVATPVGTGRNSGSKRTFVVFTSGVCLPCQPARYRLETGVPPLGIKLDVGWRGFVDEALAIISAQRRLFFAWQTVRNRLRSRPYRVAIAWASAAQDTRQDGNPYPPEQRVAWHDKAQSPDPLHLRYVYVYHGTARINLFSIKG
jgi:hypothetical protein